MPISKNTKYMVGGGAALVGVFFALRQLQRFLAQRKLDELRQKAVNGEISTRTFLEAALISGEPACNGCARVTIEEAKRLPCDRIFPPGILGASATNLGFNFDAALAELRRNGTCL